MIVFQVTDSLPFPEAAGSDIGFRDAACWPAGDV